MRCSRFCLSTHARRSEALPDLGECGDSLGPGWSSAGRVVGDLLSDTGKKTVEERRPLGRRLGTDRRLGQLRTTCEIVKEGAQSRPIWPVLTSAIS